MPEPIRKPLHVTRLEAAAIYEGLTLLSFWKAKDGKSTHTPYSTTSVDVLAARVIDEAWPELAATYRGNRKERRS